MSNCTEQLRLGYTPDDDGVWVECPNLKHEWARNLGFEATPSDAVRAQAQHDNDSRYRRVA